MNCRLCNSDKLFYRNWGGAECQKCRSINTVNIPTKEKLVEHYSKDESSYYSKNNTSKLNRYSLRYLKLLQKYSNKGNLIDLGSSSTPFPLYAARKGYQVTAGDISQEFKTDKEVKRIVISLNEKLKNNNKLFNSFDIVTCFAVIEHTINPVITINNISNLVKSGGKVFITMPNIGEWYDWYSAGGSRWYDPPGHLHIISRQSTISIFHQNGCKVIDQGVFELDKTRFLIRYSILFFEGVFGFLLSLLMPSIWKKMRSQFRSYGMGLSYFVFQKN